MDRRFFLLGGATAAAFGGSSSIARPQTVAANGISLVRDVRYRDGGSEAWKLNYAMPIAGGKATPAIVLIHGGGWIRGDKSSFDSYCTDFAKLGFFTATINYRLASEAPCPAAIEDCKCAIRWLRHHAADYNIDPDRIGVMGESAGAHLALIVGMTGEDMLAGDEPWPSESSRVRSVVSDSGPVTLDPDASPLLRTQLLQFLSGPGGTLAGRVRRFSPINHIGASTPPLLLMYGTVDGQVKIGPVDEFVLATQKAGLNDITYLRLAKIAHCPYRIQKVEYLQPIVVDFLRRTLMDYPAPCDRQDATCKPIG